MTTDTRAYLWYKMIDSERLYRYYAKLADRWSSFHLRLSLITIIGSLGAGVTLLIPISNVIEAWLTVALFLLVASLTSILLVYDFSRKSQIARKTSEQMSEIGLELHDAWYRGEYSFETIQELGRRLNAVTENDLGADHKLNEQCAEEAYKVLVAEHGGNKVG